MANYEFEYPIGDKEVKTLKIEANVQAKSDCPLAIRDLLAGFALASAYVGKGIGVKEMASRAYEIADAMLEEAK